MNKTIFISERSSEISKRKSESETPERETTETTNRINYALCNIDNEQEVKGGPLV